MLLLWFGISIAGAFSALSDLLQEVLPDDAFSAALAIGEPLAFLVPPGFVSTVPLAIAAIVSANGIRLLLNMVGRK